MLLSVPLFISLCGLRMTLSSGSRTRELDVHDSGNHIAGIQPRLDVFPRPEHFGSVGLNNGLCAVLVLEHGLKLLQATLAIRHVRVSVSHGGRYRHTRNVRERHAECRSIPEIVHGC